MSLAIEEEKLFKVLNKNYNNLENLFNELQQSLVYEQQRNSFNEYNSHKIKLIQHLSELSNSYNNVNFFIDSSLNNIKIIIDEHHALVQYNDLNNFVITEHSLPSIITILKSYPSLESIVTEFKTAIEDLGEYFEAMENLDAYCWIIDPAIPTMKENFRRIIIDDDVSIIITVGIGGCQEPPNIKVMGPSRLTAPIIRKIHETTVDWNSNMSMSDNLLNLLGISHFPKPPVKDPETAQLFTSNSDFECSICLSSRDMTDSLPSIICENSFCQQKFHTGCLYQWLSAVSNNVERMNTIYGECPSCSFTISCPVQNTFNY